MSEQNNLTNQVNEQVLICPKHKENNISSKIIQVCCKQNQKLGQLLCQQCIQQNQGVYHELKNYIFPLQEFINVQSKINQKLIPQINQSILNLDEIMSDYQKKIEKDVTQINQDFESIYKIFHLISENAKQYMIDKVKQNYKKTHQKYLLVKKNFETTQKNKQKDNSFFSMIFSKDSQEVEVNSLDNLVLNLIQKNQPWNDLLAETLGLIQNLDQFKQNEELKYHQNPKIQRSLTEIQQNLEQFLRDNYKKLKNTLNPSQDFQQEVRNSVFIDTLQSELNQTVAFDISLNSSFTSLKDSVAQFEKQIYDDPQINLKKIPQFPQIQNKNVLEVLKKVGPLDLNIEGSIFNNFPEKGPYEFEDGSVYQGNMYKNQRHGKGKFLFTDGAFYEGYWKNDIPYGFGRLIRSNGDLFEGMCNNYKANGKGLFISFNGNYVYKGEWKDDKKSGYGEEIQKQKYEYKGEYQDGVFQGNGVIKLADGSEYTGEFSNGEITGQGNMNYSNGEKYLGTFLKGVKNGQGIYIWTDGTKYEGNYVDDLAQGQGLFFWPDGFIYKGNWHKGAQHGVGTEIDPLGNNKQGLWENGEWVRWL